MKIVRILGLLIAGAGVGGGAAYGTSLVLGPPAPTSGKPAPEPTAFVPAGPLLVPVTFPDGRLSGYVRVSLQIEVAEEEVDALTARVPLLLHAANMRTYLAPLASGPDGLIPDVALLRRVLAEAAAAAWGKAAVKSVAITGVEPV